MSLKISPDFMNSCDFELALKVMDKFVENVLVGTDKHQKKRLVEKFKRYQELSELLVEKEKKGLQIPFYVLFFSSDDMFIRLIRILSRSSKVAAGIAMSFPSMRLASSSFVIEEETLAELPTSPIEIPSTPDQLTNKFLLKQSSILSAEAAARTLTLLVSTIEDHVQAYLEATSQLSNLYELGAQYQLTPAGQDKTLELRSVINEKRKYLHDFELVFAYVQKLMEINR